MDIITSADIQSLLAPRTGPCLSLYLPTDRRGSEQDPIRYQNLLKQAEEQLSARGLAAVEVRKFLAPAGKLVEDRAFWRQLSDGLALFVTPDLLRSYRLPESFAERAIVGERFDIKALLPLVTGNGRFYVLAISQKQVRLIQATLSAAHEIDVKKAPHSLAEALRFHDKDEPLLFHTRPTSGGGWGAIFHGHGVGIDDKKNDLLRYFQEVDHALIDALREEKAPLVLASVEYLWPIYRQASKHPFLLEKGIAGNPERLSIADLHRQALALVQPYLQAAQGRALEVYLQAAGTGRTAADLPEVMRAAHAGQIEVLFVARNQEVWGRYDPEGFHVHDRRQPGDEDLLNFAAGQVLLHRGTVYVVEASRVPGGVPLAAIFWLNGKREK